MKYLIIYNENNFEIVEDNVFIFNYGEYPIAIIKLTDEIIETIKES